MRRSLAFVAVGLLAASAFGDLDVAEKRWVQECVENLGAKSALVRGSAEKAIAGLGPDALPVVVAASVKLKTDADWLALSRGIAGMGSGARAALEALRMSWPKGTAGRFASVLDFLDQAAAEAKKNPPAGLPSSPADVDARVRQILEGYRSRKIFSAEDAGVRQIVAMGHPAVGALLGFLKRDDADFDNWAARSAAESALAELAEPGDVPAIAGLLNEARTTAAHGLKNIDTPEAIAALVDAVNHGFVDSDLLSGIEHKGKDPKIQLALCGWLKRARSASNEFVVGQVAAYLGENDVAGAVPVLLPWLTRLTELQPRQYVASALTDLGEKAGIPVLIDTLTAPDGHGPSAMRFDYPRHCAGLALNRISGTQTYTGKQVDRGPGPGGVDYDADWPGTATAFLAWWAKSKDTIRYDAATRSWSSK